MYESSDKIGDVYGASPMVIPVMVWFVSADPLLAGLSCFVVAIFIPASLWRFVCLFRVAPRPVVVDRGPEIIYLP